MAPLIFPAVYEYPLTVGLACLLAPTPKASKSPWPNLIALAATMAAVALLQLGADVAASPMALGILVGLAVLGLLMWRGRTRSFAPVMAVLLLGQQTSLRLFGEQAFVGRSFFGVLHVQVDYDHLIEDPSGQQVKAPRYVRLLHGSIVHGLQSMDPKNTCEPLGYYARSGPLGEIMAELAPRTGRVDQVAVIGLGTGAAACYAGPERFITFYEIDPLVLRLAETHFTYLSDCGDGHVSVVLGDGRLKLATAPNNRYRLIVLDAFSSDAIPMHLLTREALAVYLDKLAPRRRHRLSHHEQLSRLSPRLGDAGGRCGARGTRAPRSRQRRRHQSGQVHRDVCGAGPPKGRFTVSSRLGSWQPLHRRERDRVWTDDYANILGALKWDPTGALLGREKDEASRKATSRVTGSTNVCVGAGDLHQQSL